MTADKNPHSERTTTMPDEQTNAAFVGAVRRIEPACNAFLDEEAGLRHVQGRRYLVVSTLMRSVGIEEFLASRTMDHPRTHTDLLRYRIYQVFGDSSDWGKATPLGRALSDLYLAQDQADNNHRM